MNREMAITVLNVLAQRYAKHYGLNIETRRNPSNGLWDSTEFTGLSMSMTEYLTSEYGKMESVHYTKVPFEDYDLRKDFKVSFEYRFANPQICIGTQWGDDGFALLELYDTGTEGSENYEINQLMCFREKGFELLKMLKCDFETVCKELKVNDEV